MTFIIDPSTLVTLKNYDFPFITCMDFWDWLKERCINNEILIPEKVHGEVLKRKDDLTSWVTNLTSIPTTRCLPHIQRVLDSYAKPMPSQITQYLESRADPYVIAHALEQRGMVISDERSAPDVKNPQRKKIPDICRSLNVPCVHITRFIWDHRGVLPS